MNATARVTSKIRLKRDSFLIPQGYIFEFANVMRVVSLSGKGMRQYPVGGIKRYRVAPTALINSKLHRFDLSKVHVVSCEKSYH
jgi:hypothetical protein